jgi:hypothetical protein
MQTKLIKKEYYLKICISIHQIHSIHRLGYHKNDNYYL